MKAIIYQNLFELQRIKFKRLKFRWMFVIPINSVAVIKFPNCIFNLPFKIQVIATFLRFLLLVHTYRLKLWRCDRKQLPSCDVWKLRWIQFYANILLETPITLIFLPCKSLFFSSSAHKTRNVRKTCQQLLNINKKHVARKTHRSGKRTTFILHQCADQEG